MVEHSNIVVAAKIKLKNPSLGLSGPKCRCKGLIYLGRYLGIKHSSATLQSA